jgi:hypothetical protein
VDELRFVLPRGPLPRQACALAARYEPAETVDAQVDELIAGGWLVRSDDGLGPGPGTIAYLDELYNLHTTATTAWCAEDLSELLDLTATLLAAGTPTGGPAYSVFTPRTSAPATRPVYGCTTGWPPSGTTAPTRTPPHGPPVA